MNRFTAAGLALAASNGLRIAVVCRTHATAEQALADLSAVVADLDLAVSTGPDRIRFPTGGVLRTVSAAAPNAERGLAVDVVYIDTCALGHEYELAARFRPCIMASRRGQVITA